MRISTTSTRTSRLGAALACAAALSVVGSGAGEGSDAREVIQATVNQVLGVLRDESRSDDQRRTELEAIANAHFDFRTMSRLVMGRNWKRLEDGKRDEFVTEFRTYLANDYGDRLRRYDQEEVAVLREEPKPRGDVVVATQIVGGENDGALVNYRMRRSGDQWLIIDVVIEGISLVANFRDQFREVVNTSGPEGLLKKLREKNAQRKT